MSRLLLALGLAALLGAGAVVLAARPPADVGAPLTATAGTGDPSSGAPLTDMADTVDPDPTVVATGTPSPVVTTSPSEAEVVPAIGTRSARLADRGSEAAATVAAPARLAVPAIGVDAVVGPVGVEPDGQMTVPADVREVGWYRHGPVPGADGSAVLAGHVDSRTQGRGAFFDLGAVQVGDEVEVTDDAGDTTTWVVTGRQTIEKAALPLEEVFRRDGAPRLVLITCGGDFDAAQRSYRSNVVVTAEPRP